MDKSSYKCEKCLSIFISGYIIGSRLVAMRKKVHVTLSNVYKQIFSDIKVKAQVKKKIMTTYKEYVVFLSFHFNSV